MILQKQEFFHVLSPHIPSKLIHLFTFGYETLVAQPITSTRTNARRSPHLWHTAKSKMWRLLKNERLASILPTLVFSLGLVSGDDVVAVDFSDFKDGRQVLMFAKQTKTGRALPLYFEVLEYPIQKDSQNLFVIATIKRFYATLGCTPTLVFDRGFACPSIIRYLLQNNHIFIIRTKKRTRYTNRKTGEVYAAEDHQTNDLRVVRDRMHLRLVRSDDPENGNDPWYLITNDMKSKRNDIINLYYHRFEIEEFFRDAKRLLRLEWTQFRTRQSLTVALWFALMTVWLFDTIADTLTDAQESERKQWRLSRFRYVFELLEREAWRMIMTRSLEGANPGVT